MNILIMGCSFGVPQYFGTNNEHLYHTEYLLKSQGHQVHNVSKNSGSNLLTLQRAKNYLTGQRIEHPAYKNQRIVCKNVGTIDMVIWFHTEITRDRDIDHNYIYQQFANFFNLLGAKTAVIGGAGDLLDLFDQYIKPDFCIRSWRRYILGSEIPLSNTLWSKFGITETNISLEEKIKLIDNDLILRDLLGKSPHFPDGCHPGKWPHQDLVEQLSQHFGW